MPDETIPVTPVTTDTVKTTSDALSPLLKELGDDAVVVKKVLADAKTLGFKEAVVKNLPEIVAETKDDITVVKNALPVIKDGWKTSEFWLIFLFGLANVAYPVFTGKALPFDTNAITLAAIAVYTAVRGLIKKQTPAVVTPVTQ